MMHVCGNEHPKAVCNLAGVVNDLAITPDVFNFLAHIGGQVISEIIFSQGT
ncbi:MAG: hypothetical protein ACAH10_15465 [Methylophilaceae bacterium]